MDKKFLETTNIKAYFKILSDNIDSKQLDSILGLAPDKSWTAGDTWKGDRVRSFSLWEIGTQYEETLFVDDQVKKMLLIVECKKDILKRIKKELDLECTCEIVVRIEKDQTPAICIHKDLIDFAHYVGAEIDVDTYIL